jgi:hypothetical protein
LPGRGTLATAGEDSQGSDYIDVYWVLAVIALSMVPVALLLRSMEKGVTRHDLGRAQGFAWARLD